MIDPTLNSPARSSGPGNRCAPNYAAVLPKMTSAGTGKPKPPGEGETMALADFGLTSASLRESISPEQNSLDVRGHLGLIQGDPEEEASFVEIISAGLEVTGIDPDSMRGAALLDWAAQTDREATARGE